MSKVAVIGGGASGLVASIFASKNNDVTIFCDQNALGKKILVTGNGRCNFTNEKAEFFSLTIGTMSSCFGIEAAFEDGRAYPRSMEASSVAQALVFAAEKAGAGIFCGAHVTRVRKNSRGFEAECEDGRVFFAPRLVLACGGKAAIHMGCYGEGYKWASELGHSVIKPIPALDALVCSEDISALHGVRVRAKAALLAFDSDAFAGKLLAEESGEVQFTKDAVSGICVMDLSRCVRTEEGRRFVLSLDLFPDVSAEDLAKLLADRAEAFGSGLCWMLPEKLSGYIQKAVPAESFEALAAAAKDLRFSIKGTRGWKSAQTTCGGVPLGEVDKQTFASRIVPGLYITGEMLDYDGPCGGFNLDWAIHTGNAAGSGMLKDLQGAENEVDRQTT